MFSKFPKQKTSTRHTVKYNTLHIYWTKEDEDNANVEEIEQHFDSNDYSFKYPELTEVELAKDHNIESSDEEDDDE